MSSQTQIKQNGSTELLTPRWHPATLSQDQYRYVTSDKRINVVVAGRRSFKTEGAKRRLVLQAIQFSKFSDGRFFACAPTHQQAKDIFWEDLKSLTPTWVLRGQDRKRAISDGELTIDLANGARIKVAGLDRPARIEGKDWDGGVITEFGDCKADVFQFHIRPMMTRGGSIDIEGVPEGRNHYYDLAMDVKDSDGAKNPKLRQAAYHHWTTEDVLHLWLGHEAAQAELDEAMAFMDTSVFNQEYRAQFVSFEGKAYYAFGAHSVATGNHRVLYDPSLPLVLCFDFNREPGVCAYIQEQPRDRFPWATTNHRKPTVTCCIGEVYIKRNSNTRKVCDRIKADWADVHSGEVLLYGDPAGGARTSSAVDGSDWDIIKAELKPVFEHRLRDRVAKSAPSIRARINSVNTRLEAADRSVGLLVDAKACKYIVRDFEGVECDSQGNIVKVQGGPLTHISDAIGYYIHEKHPCGGSVFTVGH